MNTYTRPLKNDGVEHITPVRTHHTKPWLLGFAVRISLICLLIFCAVAYRINFNAKIEALNKRSAQIKTQLKELNIQIYNLRNRREELTAWPSISEKITRYQLGLREADYRQISYVSLMDPPIPRKKVLKQKLSSESGAKKRTAGEYAQISRNR